MILDRISSPQQHMMPGAEEQLPTTRFVFSSGNLCDVTIGMKRVAPGSKECRISVHYAWVQPPSPEEENDMKAALRSCGLPGEPLFKADSSDLETTVGRGERWLEQGVRPVQ